MMHFSTICQVFHEARNKQMFELPGMHQSETIQTSNKKNLKSINPEMLDC